MLEVVIISTFNIITASLGYENNQVVELFGE